MAKTTAKKTPSTKKATVKEPPTRQEIRAARKAAWRPSPGSPAYEQQEG